LVLTSGEHIFDVDLGRELANLDLETSPGAAPAAPTPAMDHQCPGRK
jgi:hypothetical protein